MIVACAEVEVLPGRAEAYEQAFRRLAAFVRAEEPGTVLYEIARRPGSAAGYLVFEAYRDVAAQQRHITNLAGAPGLAELLACLAGEPRVRVHRCVA